ncbi:MAG: WD40 repeat domain-containing protein [Anaerolineae bacterium]
MRAIVILVILSVLLAGCRLATGPTTPTAPTVAQLATSTGAMIGTQPTPVVAVQPDVAFHPEVTAIAPGETGAGAVTPSPVDSSSGGATQACEVSRWGIGLNHTVTWSPDGQWLAVGTDSGVYLYDTQAMEPAYYIETQSAVYATRFSPDSSRLAVGLEKGGVELWQVSGGEQLWSLGYTLPIYSVAFSPDGKFLATGLCTEWREEWDCMRSQVQLLEAETGQVVRTLQPEIVAEVASLTFSPDGRFLAAKGGPVWEIPTGQQVQDLGRDVHAVAFSSDGAFLAAGYLDPVVRIFGVSTWKLVRTLEMGSGHHVSTLDLSSDGAFLARGDWDTSLVQLWNLTTGKVEWEKRLQGVIEVAFSPRGDLLAAVSPYESVRLWDVHTGQEAGTLTGSWGMVERVLFFPHGADFVVGNWRGGIWLWNVSTRQLKCLVREQIEQMIDMALSSDGNLLAIGLADNTVHLWDVMAGREIGVLLGMGRGLAFSPDGTTLAVQDTDGTIRFWDIKAGHWISLPQWSAFGTVVLRFSSAGDLLAAGTADGLVRLWSIETGEAIHLVGKHTDTVWSVAFSPDGQYLASGSDDETLRLWEVKTGRLVRVFKAGDRVRSVVFSPDSTLLAGGTWHGSIQLWEVATGKAIQVLRGHTWVVNSLDFSSDGRYLLSGSSDGTVRLWDMAER